MRHHTGTHILLHACKQVLGSHVHQAGAQKGSDTSRLDIRHFRHITPEELGRIEIEANRMVMMALPVYIRWEERTHAEQKYGFDLYQGGVPPGKEIRVVQVDGEVQACGGTHCGNTGEVGAIKVIRVEHIQDGIERLEFAAGTAALYAMQRVEGLLSASALALSVQPENLPAAVQRFFIEWKEQRKEIERLQAKVAELSAASAAPEIVGGVPVLVQRADLPPKELAALAQKIADQGGVALLAGGSGKVNVAAASGTAKVSAAELVAAACAVLGGKGGGTPQRAQGGGADASKIDEALAEGKRLIGMKLHG
jgi:alanyl-tRNA synthetase